jgi:hypothetical protein
MDGGKTVALLDEIKALADSMGIQFVGKDGVYRMSMTVAERKAFLSRKKLEYIASFKIDDAGKKMSYTEMLKESGSGVTGAEDFDESGMTTGFGFKTETYRTGPGPREGTIIEQSDFFGRKYDYRFDFRKVRERVEQLAEREGYRFFYELTAGGW